jgi:geranyl-CoA carboxylase beta subunit
MSRLQSFLNPDSDAFLRQRAVMLERIAELRALEARAAAASTKAQPLFLKRKQLLPRERVSRLLDPGAPWLELSSLAGFGIDRNDSARSIPGAGVITGIGVISGTRCVVSASDSGIDAGAIQPMGREKIERAQTIALENALPFVQLIESAGANLMRYRVEDFIHGGRLFYNLARLSSAGIPVISVVHGSSTAGGAYLPGLSDYVIMVKDRARAFLAGPPLLRAATGEVATDEELGGAHMHTHVSGLGEYLARDDDEALRIARELIAQLDFDRAFAQWPAALADETRLAPLYSPDELAGVMPTDFRTPIDMREVIARVVDSSDFLEFKPDYGSATVCGHAAIGTRRIGIITNNGPIDPAGSQKATHFIQACCQSGQALLYLQNTTGYIVGKASEQAGMIKHGSKMIQAVSNANVPSVTIHCGASFGAGNYGMAGRAFGPRFVFSWPNARTAVMGGEQAARTMRIVTEAAAQRKGEPVNEQALAALESSIIETFEHQAGVLYTSARLLDDGVIDPRDTRRVLAFVFDLCARADSRTLRPVQFGVARP